MKRVFILSLLSFFVGCGITEERIDTSYDMWQYMTPSANYEVEYNIYENGKHIDYAIETVSVLDEGRVEWRNNKGEIELLRRESENIVVEYVGSGITTYLKRYVEVGEENVTDACSVAVYHRSIWIKSIEFYNVIQLTCNEGLYPSNYYYAYDEGLVGSVVHNGLILEELVKVRERKL